MKLKKFNAVTTWFLTLFLIVHVIGEAVTVVLAATGSFPSETVQTILTIASRATAVAALIHGIISIAMIFTTQECKDITYKGPNARTFVQRITADITFIFMFLHVFFVSNGTGEIGTVKLIFSILIDVVFFVAIFAHLSVSFSKSLITMGIISTDAAEAKANAIAFRACNVIRIIAILASVLFLLYRAGIF